jgi:ABC-type dipeptide/oligopeptide/nickel transport system permease component
MRGVDYIVKRTGFALVTVFVAITFNFLLFRAVPGNAVTNLARVPQATQETRAALTRDFGLDKSKWEQYVIYLRQLAHGNLGISFGNRKPVAQNLAEDLRNTIPMVLLGTMFAAVFGTVTGILAAWRRGTILDHGSVMTALVFYSLPTQWLALMMIVLFAIVIPGFLPTGGMRDDFLIDPTLWQSTVDILKHMLLPSLTIGLAVYGEFTLIVRSAMLETLGEDYVLTARAKGLSDWAIVRRHALRNALLPLVTLFSLHLGLLVAGAILVETVFSWPGIGRAVYDALLQRDYPMLQGAFLVLTLSIVFFNYLADLVYFKLDPRITE